MPGSFGYAVHHLLDHEFTPFLFDARYRNDQSDASAYEVEATQDQCATVSQLKSMKSKMA